MSKSKYLSKIISMMTPEAQSARKAIQETNKFAQKAGEVLPVPQGGDLSDLRDALEEIRYVERRAKSGAEEIAEDGRPGWNNFVAMKGLGPAWAGRARVLGSDKVPAYLQSLSDEFDGLWKKANDKDEAAFMERMAVDAEKVKDFPSKLERPVGKQRWAELSEVDMGKSRGLENGDSLAPLKNRAVVPLAAAGLENPIDILKTLFGKYEDAKDVVAKPLSKELNLSRNPDDQEILREVLKMGLDPINAIPGAAGVGAGAVQFMGSR